jgi:hypothetical protein
MMVLELFSLKFDVSQDRLDKTGILVLGGAWLCLKTSAANKLYLEQKNFGNELVPTQ